MNDDVIFRKTPAGAEAIRERTRLVQRNLRMVLILVDSVANVGVLKHLAGDAAIAESSLAELEGMGLVERAAPESAASPNAEPEAEAAAETAIPTSIGDIGPETQWPASIFPEQAAYGVDSIIPMETAGASATVQESLATSGPAKPSVLSGIFGGKKESPKDEVDFEQTVFDFGDGDISSGALGSAAAAEPEAKRAWRPKIRVKALALSVVAVFVAVIVWQLFIRSYDAYRPEFERALSAIVDDSVTIGKVRVSYLPAPAILLDDVKVGSPDHTTIAAIHLASEPWSFLGDHHRFRRVTLDGMHVRDADLPKLAKWLSPGRMTNVTVDRLDIANLTLELGPETVTGLAGEIELGGQASIEKVAFRSSDGTLWAEAKPAAGAWMISLVTNGWKAPVKPAAFFSKFDVHGRLVPGRFTISQLTAHVCDGLIVGSGTVDWQHQPAMSLSLDVQHVGANCLLTELGAPALLDGQTDAGISMTAAAPSFHDLSKTWQLDGKFGISRGALKHIDLADALRNRASESATRGGSTPFEQLQGTVSVTDRIVRVGSSRMDAGLMQASGQATVSRQQGAIAGSINAELRGSAGVVRAPIAISGSATEPELKAAR